MLSVKRELLVTLCNLHAVGLEFEPEMSELRAILDKPVCTTPAGLPCPGDGVSECKKCPGKVVGRHTMRSVMVAVEASVGYICLTSDQCAALAQALNGAEQ